ncbi:transglycosylase SLT domain-containing protein [Acidovorax sp. LjRoot129]|uniref:transglycosylase SLT domain-containing protein n=1 Tax=Acidovorax sp. LjRoot129 TaxID=3342260 RepID=UPI003ECC6929
MNRLLYLLAGVVVVLVAVDLAQRQAAPGAPAWDGMLPDGWQGLVPEWGDQAEPPEPVPDDGQSGNGQVISTNLFEDMINSAKTSLGLWRPPAAYAGMIATAETTHGIPRDMLARLLWQECRYREDIITGRVASSAGALGIAQFMPATAREMGIDPLNVPQAIDAAGRYLARLYNKFGNWTEALAAYNWGQGNVQRKGLGSAPQETRNYYSQILADVNAGNGTNWA